MTLDFLKPDRVETAKPEEKPVDGTRSTDILYLEKLQFRPELRKTWLNFFISNFRVVILLIILISIWGVYSFFRLPRESNPQVSIPVGLIITTYPGVGPADIEELVTKKIETGISGVKGIKTITSNSSDSVSTISVEFDASQDLTNSIRSLRDQMSSIKNNLPADANDPIVNEISLDDTPILSIAITGPYDGFKLKTAADDLKDEIEKIAGVRQVNVSGGDTLEFEVAYDPQKLTFYNISVDQANQIIKSTNLAFPAGAFEGSQYTYPVRADARFFDIAHLKMVPLFHTDNGAVIYLKDIATVSEKAVRRTTYSTLSINGSEPQPAVELDVIKKTGGNILNSIDMTKQVLNSNLPKLLPGAKYDTVNDLSKTIRTQFDQLTHDFLLTITLVFAILFLIVGLKEALVAGMAVPLVFFVSFGVMQATGITLNFLSIFSLLLSLGLLVDDAIVVVTATKQYIKTGKFTPEEAVLLVLNDFKIVLTTTTLTTVWAFLPLLLASGIIGSFIKSVPITVSVTLVSSLAIALMVNHPLAAVLERIRLTKNLFFALIVIMLAASYGTLSLNSLIGYLITAVLFAAILTLARWYIRGGRVIMERNQKLMDDEWRDDALIKNKLREQGTAHDINIYTKLIHGIFNINRILPLYDRFLCNILLNRRKMLGILGGVIAVFIFAVSLPATGILPTEFFPNSNEVLILASMRASTGLNLTETNKILLKAEEKLRKYPEIENFSAVAGSGGTATVLAGSFGGGSGNSNLASITINLVDKDKRKITSYDLATKINDDFKDIREATFSVSSIKGGPPSGSAFDAQISGDDLQVLDTIAHDLKPYLDSIPGVVNSDISLKNAPAQYTFTLDPTRLELYNLNAAYVGSILRTAITGTKASTVVINGKEININATFEPEHIPNLEAIQNLQILNLKKQPVFLKDVAKIQLIPSVETITRIDQKRTVLLTADASGQTSSNAILAAFQKNITKYKMPAGYTISYGGENQQNVESVQSILQAMVLAGLLIISTLVLQFNSFKEAVIVLVTIPLALIGVFIGMTIFRIPLSFPGLIGVLALFGIVVKNAIILIDKINLNLRTGIGFEDSIIDAGKSRFEAIFITSIATIVGIIPVTLSSEIWRALGSSIIFGLMLSSFLTLFIVPILYSIFMRKKYLKDHPSEFEKFI